MIISVIVSVYRDVNALEIILDSIAHQTVLPYEVIVAEDGEYDGMSACIHSQNRPFILKHTHHEDIGWRKTRSLNNALKVAEGSFIIIIDGDCLMHHRYIENMTILSEKRTVLCGRRVHLDGKSSMLLREKKVSPIVFSSSISWLFKLAINGARNVEEGIYLGHSRIMRRLFSNRKKASLLGCSWGAPKDLFFEVNGFDEDYDVPTAGEDTDIEIRMRRAGILFKRANHSAIVYHLFHSEKYCSESNKKAIEILNSRGLNIKCKNGLEYLAGE